MSTASKIRVLIVEDSEIEQEFLIRMLSEDAEFKIIGIVNNGHEAVKFIAANKPDVISMDINMPGMDGIETTRQIMQHNPVPIVIVSSAFTASEVKLLVKILEAGALTIIPRPKEPGHPKYHETAKNYRNTLKVIAKVKVNVISRLSASAPKVQNIIYDRPVFSVPVPASSGPPSYYKIIAIGASAGGPQIIQFILKELPASISVPVLIVQHIDGTFAEGYFEWLSMTSNLPLHTAVNGEKMQPGHVYLPPGDHHLGVLSPGVISVSKAPPEKGLRPAVSILFRTVMTVYGRNSIGVILSGMGSDGAAELKLLRDCGAYTIAQDAQSSVVHGMPGEAIRIGGATAVLSPREIVAELIRLLPNKH
jgi:two-component system, chemotaxis family, protein-glutamate methylesterase/glutaminase